MVQIHKEFTDSQIKELIERYLKNEIERKYIQEVLSIGKTRFFALIKDYRKNPNEFSIQYRRKINSIASRGFLKPPPPISNLATIAFPKIPIFCAYFSLYTE